MWKYSQVFNAYFNSTPETLTLVVMLKKAYNVTHQFYLVSTFDSRFELNHLYPGLKQQTDELYDWVIPRADLLLDARKSIWSIYSYHFTSTFSLMGWRSLGCGSHSLDKRPIEIFPIILASFCGIKKPSRSRV